MAASKKVMSAVEKLKKAAKALAGPSRIPGIKYSVKKAKAKSKAKKK